MEWCQADEGGGGGGWPKEQDRHAPVGTHACHEAGQLHVAACMHTFGRLQAARAPDPTRGSAGPMGPTPGSSTHAQLMAWRETEALLPVAWAPHVVLAANAQRGERYSCLAPAALRCPIPHADRTATRHAQVCSRGSELIRFVVCCVDAIVAAVLGARGRSFAMRPGCHDPRVTRACAAGSARTRPSCRT